MCAGLAAPTSFTDTSGPSTPTAFVGRVGVASSTTPKLCINRRPLSAIASGCEVSAGECDGDVPLASIVGPGKSFAVADKFEHTLSTGSDLFESKTDTPYHAWCRVRELCEGCTDLAHVPNLKQVLTFMFAP